MQTAGILVYGYNSEDASVIKSCADRTLGFPGFMTSATEKTNEKISELLKTTADNRFADEATKILMLIGFTDEQIRTFLADFPSRDGRVQRPIFCLLTDENQNWPFAELVDHLQEEHRYWSTKKP